MHSDRLCLFDLLSQTALRASHKRRSFGDGGYAPATPLGGRHFAHCLPSLTPTDESGDGGDDQRPRRIADDLPKQDTHRKNGRVLEMQDCGDGGGHSNGNDHTKRHGDKGEPPFAPPPGEVEREHRTQECDDRYECHFAPRCGSPTSCHQRLNSERGEAAETAPDSVSMPPLHAHGSPQGEPGSPSARWDSGARSPLGRGA